MGMQVSVLAEGLNKWKSLFWMRHLRILLYRSFVNAKLQKTATAACTTKSCGSSASCMGGSTANMIRHYEKVRLYGKHETLDSRY
jgi:hypothetical protein